MRLLSVDELNEIGDAGQRDDHGDPGDRVGALQACLEAVQGDSDCQKSEQHQGDQRGEARGLGCIGQPQQQGEYVREMEAVRGHGHRTRSARTELVGQQCDSGHPHSCQHAQQDTRNSRGKSAAVTADVPGVPAEYAAQDGQKRSADALSSPGVFDAAPDQHGQGDERGGPDGCFESARARGGDETDGQVEAQEGDRCRHVHPGHELSRRASHSRPAAVRGAPAASCVDGVQRNEDDGGQAERHCREEQAVGGSEGCGQRSLYCCLEHDAARDEQDRPSSARRDAADSGGGSWHRFDQRLSAGGRTAARCAYSGSQVSVMATIRSIRRGGAGSVCGYRAATRGRAWSGWRRRHQRSGRCARRPRDSARFRCAATGSASIGDRPERIR